MDEKKKEVLNQFRVVFEQVGYDISANEYDRLKIDKPSRHKLKAFDLSWAEMKSLVIPEVPSSDPTYQALISQNKALTERIAKEKDLTRAFVDNCLASIGKRSFKPAKVPKKEKVKENQQAHALRSDAHVGEYLDPDWVQGLNRYDADTYKKRVERWTEKMILFREQDKASLGLNKLILHLLGDQVTGENIFKGQRFYLDLHLTDQLFYSLEVETNQILALAEVYPEIEIFCVLGNHGRPGMKGENHHKTNFDYIFYRSLQKALEPQKNIKVFVSESPSMIAQHGNFVFLLNHGDNTRGWNGIPFYGLERTFRRLPGLYNMVINYELTAHFHQPCNLSDKVLMNGSLVGGDDLSINRMGLTNLPSQKLFYFDIIHGINRESNLYLADPVQLKPDSNGIFTAYK